MLNDVLKDMEVNKELLTNLPKNNVKNINKSLEKINSLLETYNQKLKEVEKEMQIRYQTYKNYQINPQIDEKKNKRDDLFNKLYLLDNKSPYEKSGLSRLIYDLEKFFNNDLVSVNETIKKIIDVFTNIGINLTINDFDYTYYVNIYMNNFLENKSFAELRLCFEDIYFKSPTLFKQISLNFKYLYYKNIKQFTEYYKKQENELLNDKIKKDIYKEFFVLNDSYQTSLLEDKYTLVTNLLNGKLNFKNYYKEEITKTFKLFIDKDLTDDDINNLKPTISNLLKSLYEYQGYLKYSFIIDDLKKKYQEKDKYKNISSSKYKELLKKQNGLFKNNKKIKRLLRKRVPDRIKINNLINISLGITDELDNLYLEYEENLFLELFLNTNLDTTIFDVLNISLASYVYLVKIFKMQDEEIDNETLNLQIEEFIKFVRETRFTVLNHIKLDSNDDLDYIIIDKYNLLGLNLLKDSLKNDLDNLILNSNIILNYYYVTGINLDNINYLIECDKLNK